MATADAGVQYLAYSTNMKLASAPVEETTSIEPERQAAIDGFVDETALADDAGELTGDALSGSSELGELSADEQRYLVDRSLDTWLPPDSSSGEVETNYVAIGQLATRAAQDPALGAVVLPTYADRAGELAASAPPGIDGFDERQQAAALSTEAMLAAPDEAAVRGLLEGLGPDGASHFVDALGLDSEDVYASTSASYFGGSPNLENRVVAADRLLSSLATGTPTESSQAAIAQAFLTFDKKALDPALVGELPQSLANAMGTHWYPDDPATAASEAARFGEMFNSEKGRDLFFAEGLPPASRTDALNAFLDHPEWNQTTLDAHNGSPWTNPTITSALAQPLLDRGLVFGGDVGRSLSLEQREDLIGLAMSLPSGAAAPEITDPIAAGIQAIGGDRAELTVLPIIYSSPASGTVDLPLFRVRNPDTGLEGYVDNVGRTYSSFEEWRTTNALPPGNMTYPTDGHLTAGEDGHALIGSENTPRTVDTPIETAKQILDHAALIGGIAAGGLIMMGSGGTLAPVVAGAATAWGTYRAGETLYDRWQHDQSLDPIDDPEARAAWIELGVNALGLAGSAGAKLVSRSRAARELGSIAAVDDIVEEAVATENVSSSSSLAKLADLNPRHFITKVRQKSVAKESNSVIEPWVPVQDDVAAIRNGDALYAGGRFLVNGRRYGTHDGTLYPIDGPGIHQLDRQTYKALGTFNTHMGTAREANIRDWLANMNVTEAQAEAAYQLYLLGRGAKVRRGRVVNQ